MKRTLFPLLSLTALLLLSAPVSARKKATPASPYLVVTDYVRADGMTDVADDLQRLVDANPNRTLFFPDGTYLLSHSLRTPADPTKAVHLMLANFAVLKAAPDWTADGDAVVRLGGIQPYNDINLCGSNYGIEGGIIDGSGVADGISIDSGRETRICRVAIKHTAIGIHIRHGANSGSSDADISDINIVGNNTPQSVGVLIEGYDNTLTNMRIASVHIGIWCKTGGNSMRNIHPLYIFGDKQEYDSSCGFIIAESNNWMDYCYSDQFATGFRLGRGARVNLTDCFVWWYTGNVPHQTAIVQEGPLQAFVSGLHAGFTHDCPAVTLLSAEPGGDGVLMNTYAHPHAHLVDDISAAYTK